MEEAEEGEEAGPGAEALVHGVGVERRLVAELGEEAAHGVVLDVDGVGGDEAAVLGVEDEDEAEERGEEAAVDLVAFAIVAVEDVAQEGAARGFVRGLEAAHELVEGVEHLAGEAGGDEVLVLAALAEEGREALGARNGEEALGREEHEEGRAEGAPGDLAEVGEGEVEPAGRLPFRRGDEAQGVAVREEARGDARLAQEALEARRGARVPAVGVVAAPVFAVRTAGVVERRTGRDDGDEEEPAVGGVGVGDGEGGAKGVVLVRERDAERLGERRAARRAGEVALLPAEEFACEGREVGEAKRVAGEEAAEGFLLRGDVAVGDDAGGEKGGRGDDEADRLDVAEPLLVGAEGGVGGAQEGPREDRAARRAGGRCRFMA